MADAFWGAIMGERAAARGADLPTIRACRVRQLVVPFAQPLRTASGTMPAAPMILLDLHTSAGVTGHAYLFTYTPTALRAVAALCEDVTAQLAGAALAPRQVMAGLRARFRLLGSVGLLDMVLSAIDMALWDAWAKFLGQPLAALLGADLSANDRVRAYASYGMEDREQIVRHVGAALEQGFGFVKIKIGHASLATDLEIVEAALAAMQGRAALLVDYNQSLSVAEAVVRCKALDGYGLAWIEEPTRYDDLHGHAQIAAAVDTPIQLGENLWGPAQIGESLRAGASDLMMPDLGKVGGVSGWLDATSLCGARSVPVSNHFYQEVSAHLMTVTPGAHLLEYFRMAEPILMEPVEVVHGHVRVPRRPGHGMAWNEEQVRRYLA